jgi:hypothetical protein
MTESAEEDSSLADLASMAFPVEFSAGVERLLNKLTEMTHPIVKKQLWDEPKKQEKAT